jgi:acyl transferase domain-containing protein/acyl carrier protein
MAQRLGSYLDGEMVKGVAEGRAEGGRKPKVGFIYSGQGGQWSGMGRELMEQEEEFLQAIRECDEEVREQSGWSLLEEMRAEGSATKIEGEEIEVTQAALFGMQVGMTRLWRRWGVEAEVVMGHSMGEVGGAVGAGIMSLKEGVRVITTRGRLLQRAVKKGAMIAVEMSEREAREEIRGREREVGIGAVNGERSVVVSGEAEEIEEIKRRLERRGEMVKELRTTGVAGHSPQVEEISEELGRRLKGIRGREGKARMISTVRGVRIRGEEVDGEYWRENLRKEVRFREGMEEMKREGVEVYVEVGAGGKLGGAIREAIGGGKEGRERAARVIGGGRRGERERERMMEGVGEAYVAGVEVKWEKVQGEKGERVRLPRYEFQRQPFWLDSPQDGYKHSPAQQHFHKVAASQDLLGHHLESSLHPDTHFWENELSAERFPFHNDHRVNGVGVMPAAAQLDMALAAAAHVFAKQSCFIEEVEFQRALTLDEDSKPVAQLAIVREGDNTARFQLSSLQSKEAAGNDRWLLHTKGAIRLDEAGADASRLARSSPDEIKARLVEVVPGSQHYTEMAERGIRYGPAFQCVEQLWRNGREAIARLRIRGATAFDSSGHQVDPALLDGGFQVLESILKPEGSVLKEAGVYVPVGLESMRAFDKPGRELWAYAEVRSCDNASANEAIGDLFLLTDDGRIVVEAIGLRVKRLEPVTSHLSEIYHSNLLYEAQWEPVASLNHPPQTERASWLIFSDREGTGAGLKSILTERGDQCVMLSAGEDYGLIEPGHYQINPSSPKHFQRLFRDSLSAGSLPCRGIVHLWSLDANAPEKNGLESLAAAQSLGCASVLHLVKSLARERKPPRLYLVTAGVHAVDQRQQAIAIAQSPLWGLARVIANERPELRCTRIDLSPVISRDEMQALFREVYLDADADEIALRGAARYEARLNRYSPRFKQHALRAPSPVIEGNGTYLITGGLGGLGLSVAEWMIHRGAKNLALVGRSDPSPEAARIVERIKKSGASIKVARADIADREQAARVFQNVRETMPPLKGIIHAAGILDDGILLNLDQERFEKVIAPKVYGAWNLHTLTAGIPLRLFVLFSSAGSLLGSAGQGNHAAANSFLDALAHYRRAHGLPGLSINWGPWSEVGLAARPNRAGSLALRGIGHISPATAKDALELLLVQESTQACVMPFDFEQWRQFYPRAAKSSFFSLLARGRSRPDSLKIREQALALSPGWARRSFLESHIQEQVSVVLRLARAEIDFDKPLQALGLDSLRALELRNRLESSTGLVLPATLTWKCPTIASLADHLADRMNISLELSNEATMPSATEGNATVNNLTAFEQLSEEQAVALLSRKLDLIDGKELK